MLRIVNVEYSFLQEDEDFEMGVTGGWERVVATEKKEKVDQQVCSLSYFSLFFTQKLTRYDTEFYSFKLMPHSLWKFT